MEIFIILGALALAAGVVSAVLYKFIYRRKAIQLPVLLGVVAPKLEESDAVRPAAAKKKAVK
jgi:hypothetical protein